MWWKIEIKVKFSQKFKKVPSFSPLILMLQFSQHVIQMVLFRIKHELKVQVNQAN